jgi:D-threo-aldose 1-dehydrogenase
MARDGHNLTALPIPAPTESRRLGGSSVQVSAMGLGTAPLGGLFTRVTDGQADATILRALELGIRYIDTAPLYGHGLAERRVGATLRRRGTRVVLSTKVGRLIVPGTPDAGGMFKGGPPSRAIFDFSSDGVMRSLDESLARLGMDRVDVVYIHDPDDHSTEALEQAFPTLAKLRGSGVVGAIGVGMNQAEMLTRFVRETDVDCVLVAGRYSLLDQSAARELLPACRASGVGVVVGGVYNSGILASGTLDDSRPDERAPALTYDYRPAAPELVTRAQRIAAVCTSRGVPIKAAALQFPLAHPAVTCILVGARSPAEVEENVAMLSRPVPGELWDELRAAGLLPPDSLTPAGR